MAIITIMFDGQRTAMDLGAFKVLRKGFLTSREVARIEPRLRDAANQLPKNERRRWERLGAKVATLPDTEKHHFRDEFVRRYR